MNAPTFAPKAPLAQAPGSPEGVPRNRLTQVSRLAILMSLTGVLACKQDKAPVETGTVDTSFDTAASDTATECPVNEAQVAAIMSSWAVANASLESCFEAVTDASGDEDEITKGLEICQKSWVTAINLIPERECGAVIATTEGTPGESSFKVNYMGYDTDGDGLTNAQEFTFSDLSGFTVEGGYSPCGANSVYAERDLTCPLDGDRDWDGDGVKNSEDPTPIGSA